MNANQSDSWREDPRLDLLADGELDDREQRALLLDLEERPDGWRWCALSLLEAQRWRETFGESVAAQDDAPEAPGPHRPKAPTPSGNDAKATGGAINASPLAIAAALLLAFTLGTRMPDWVAGPSGNPKTADGLRHAATREAQADVGAKAPAVDAPTPDSRSPVRQMQVLWDHTNESVTWPVYHSQDAYVQEVLNNHREFEVPDELMEQLRSRGKRLHRRRVWAPLRTSDQQAVVLVPVEQFELQTVIP